MRGLLVVFALFAFARTAYAHPVVDEAIVQADEARFEDALETFARAEAGTDLTREDVVRIFERRALVYLALGDETAMARDLERLASIAPEHQFDANVSPEVRETFFRLRGRLAGPLRVDASADGDGTVVTIRGSVRDDEASVVRDVRVAGRSGSERWVQRTNAPLVVDAAANGRVEYYVEAVGPGGAVLARAGSAEEPLEARVRRAAPVAATRLPEEDEGGVSPLLIVGVGLGVAAVAAVIVTVVVTAESDETRFTPFRVDF